MAVPAKQKPEWTGKKRVSLALQGGGAHGAFTWGVLDHILEDGRLDIEAISGTSAGAMNAVVLAEGFIDGGREGARANLERFWQSVSQEGALAPIPRSLFGAFFEFWAGENSPLNFWTDLLTHYSSPYEFNPLNLNPLRDHLDSVVDFAKVRACEEIQIFVAATNVHTGKIAVFNRDILTADHIMASACLPLVFQAVEIDGIPHWDGGYMGNPALYPLFYNAASDDVILVQINPIERNTTPKTAKEIQNRLNEITFNATLISELRAVDFVTRLNNEGNLPKGLYKSVLMHRIDGEAALAGYSAASKSDTSWLFLSGLRDIGREAAKRWLARHYDDIGRRSTLDVKDTITAHDENASPPSGKGADGSAAQALKIDNRRNL